MHTVYLTRRNLLTLISKLDRAATGAQTEKTIIKRDIFHKKFPCSDEITVIAVEDSDYYTDRTPGKAHEDDEQTILMKAVKL